MPGGRETGSGQKKDGGQPMVIGSDRTLTLNLFNLEQQSNGLPGSANLLKVVSDYNDPKNYHNEKELSSSQLSGRSMEGYGMNALPPATMVFQKLVSEQASQGSVSMTTESEDQDMNPKLQRSKNLQRNQTEVENLHKLLAQDQ